jgi:hypothetical protein
MILKTTFYAPIIALREINPASSTLFPAASRAPFVEALGPIERHALAGPFLEGVAIGGDRLVQVFRPALALAEGRKRSAEIVLGRGPVERHALAVLSWSSWLSRP